MFSKLTTKIALRKAGIPSSALAIPDLPSTSTQSSDPNGANQSQFSNPFANINITVPKSWQSWATPAKPPVEIAPAPVVGERAPSSARLQLPGADGRPTVVLFLRHCGCPFAEKSFLELRRLANKHPRVSFLAISHSSAAATEKWVRALGGAWAITVVVDEERELYANWGLGVSNSYYLLNPWTQMARTRLGKEEGNWGREVDPSGNRWQTGGAWAMDELGVVRWGGRAKTADELPDLVAGCGALGAF